MFFLFLCSFFAELDEQAREVAWRMRLRLCISGGGGGVGSGVFLGGGYRMLFCLFLFFVGDVGEVFGTVGVGGFSCSYSVEDEHEAISGIPVGGVHSMLFRSSVAAAADLSSPLIFSKQAADGRSMKMVHLGDSRCRLLRLHQCLMSPARIGGGAGFAWSSFRRIGAVVVTRRSWNLGVALCNFQVFQGGLCQTVVVCLI
jgi:hypothetical protein